MLSFFLNILKIIISGDKMNTKFIKNLYITKNINLFLTAYHKSFYIHLNFLKAACVFLQQ